jgi:hypothetical protein
VSTAPKMKSVKGVRALGPDDAEANFSHAAQQTSDFFISADIINHFAEVDLGTLHDLPSGRQELFALSVRMDRAFVCSCQGVLEFIAQDHEEIPRRVFEAVITELALGCIERYGALAFLSGELIRTLCTAQLMGYGSGPKRLREVGERLAVFAMAQKGAKPPKTIDITFTLFKPHFLAELQHLSRDLGALAPDKSRSDQMLELVGTRKYRMLRMNLSWLEEFFRSKEINPYLNGKNAMSAELLAEYGTGKVFEKKREPSMTPEWFFYTWMAWITNKSPKTVRREIKTAKGKFKRKINELVRVTKKR